MPASSKLDNSGVKKQTSKGPFWIAPYNYISALLWSYIFVTTIYYGVVLGQPLLFYKTNYVNTWIQTLAVVEVYNAAVGNVRSSPVTVAIQVASRLLIVWGVFQVLPQSPANFHWSYITLLLSWSFTEVIRYTYYAENIVKGANVPKILTLLRYNTFFVLYPTGVASEMAMIYLSLSEASRVVGSWYSLTFKVFLAVYPPGLLFLYTHMIGQRRKVMKKLKTN